MIKKILLSLLGLLLIHSDSAVTRPRFYVAITMQNGRLFHEFAPINALHYIVADFVDTPSIESVFITRDILDVYQSNND